MKSFLKDIALLVVGGLAGLMFAARGATGSIRPDWKDLAISFCTGFIASYFVLYTVFHARKRAWLKRALADSTGVVFWIERCFVRLKKNQSGGGKPTPTEIVVELNLTTGVRRGCPCLDDLKVALLPMYGSVLYLDRRNGLFEIDAPDEVHPRPVALTLRVRPRPEAEREFGDAAAAAVSGNQVAVRVEWRGDGLVRELSSSTGLAYELFD